MSSKFTQKVPVTFHLGAAPAWQSGKGGMGLHVLDASPLLRVTGEVAPGPPHPVTPDAAADMLPGAEPAAKATALGASGRALGSGGRNPADHMGDPTQQALCSAHYT